MVRTNYEIFGLSTLLVPMEVSHADIFQELTPEIFFSLFLVLYKLTE